jgi:hypothetical protein
VPSRTGKSIVASAALAVAIAFGSAVTAGPAQVQVYKSPSCGCCNKWIDHLESHGFSVRAIDVSDLRSIKAENGVPPRLSSCHTAFVEGYIVEGHVPAQDIRRLLLEQPRISGLAVPGMPIGSPGMEGPNPERYRVLSFGPEGMGVFASHEP